jgi:hypothetical protein
MDVFDYKYTGIQRKSTIKTEKQNICTLIESIDLTLESYTIKQLKDIICGLEEKYYTEHKDKQIKLRVEGKVEKDNTDIDVMLNVYLIRPETSEEYNRRINLPRQPIKIKENNIAQEIFVELQNNLDKKKIAQEQERQSKTLIGRIKNWNPFRKK